MQSFSSDPAVLAAREQLTTSNSVQIVDILQFTLNVNRIA